MHLLYLLQEKNLARGKHMESIVALFKDLTVRKSLFIKAENLPNHHVFRKTGPRSARVIGSNELITLSEFSRVIVVNEMTFGEMPQGQFVLAHTAMEPGGFTVPGDILLKYPPPANPEDSGQVRYIDVSKSCQPFNIWNNVPVIKLGNIFHFKEITVATLLM